MGESIGGGYTNYNDFYSSCKASTVDVGPAGKESVWLHEVGGYILSRELDRRYTGIALAGFIGRINLSVITLHCVRGCSFIT